MNFLRVKKSLSFYNAQKDFILEHANSLIEKIFSKKIFKESLIKKVDLNANKPCHCNLVFTIKTNIALKFYVFIPRCPYYTTYFAFRRTGIHPPTN